jgi:hypothetical protein
MTAFFPTTPEQIRAMFATTREATLTPELLSAFQLQLKLRARPARHQQEDRTND